MSGLRKLVREDLQRKTRAFYEQGHGSREIARLLGESPVSTYRRLQRMGILRGKSEAYEKLHGVEARTLPFQQPAIQENLRSAAIGLAVGWFLDRGYVPSIPLEPTRYDLVAESDEGLKRVQIKSTNYQDDYGVWTVHVHRTKYDAGKQVQGSAGKRRVVSYTKDEVDYFFIVTGDLTKYLIPIDIVGDAKNISLGKKYDSYKV